MNGLNLYSYYNSNLVICLEETQKLDKDMVYATGNCSNSKEQKHSVSSI